MNKCHDILQLIAKTKSAARLIATHYVPIYDKLMFGKPNQPPIR